MYIHREWRDNLMLWKWSTCTCYSTKETMTAAENACKCAPVNRLLKTNIMNELQCTNKQQTVFNALFRDILHCVGSNPCPQIMSFSHSQVWQLLVPFTGMTALTPIHRYDSSYSHSQVWQLLVPFTGVTALTPIHRYDSSYSLSLIHISEPTRR